MSIFTKSSLIPGVDDALPGRDTPVVVASKNLVLGGAMSAPFPEDSEIAVFGLGCFWGAEKRFWQLPGVVSTAVGYGAGSTPNPSYEEVCSGLTGHNEVVQVVYDPAVLGYQELLEEFWQAHNPTQGMRQGNDRGTQYRSGIYTNSDEQQRQAQASLQHYQQRLTAQGMAQITTEVIPLQAFYYAEDYHQQYLHKNPAGYCGLGGTGVRY